LWGSACHHVKREASRFILSTLHDMHSRAELIRYAIRKAIISLEGP